MCAVASFSLSSRFLKNRVPVRQLFIRVPYYIEDAKRDPNLENYPFVLPKPTFCFK